MSPRDWKRDPPEIRVGDVLTEKSLAGRRGGGCRQVISRCRIAAHGSAAGGCLAAAEVRAPMVRPAPARALRAIVHRLIAPRVRASCRVLTSTMEVVQG